MVTLDTTLYVDRPEAAAELARHEFRLEKFSGPLDLLLYLIRKEELDIVDIPIARITRQYLEYLEIMRALDLEVAGDYILMAATLIRIKAQMLLPRPEGEAEEEDPRGMLVAALLEYQQFKEASAILHQYESNERTLHANPGNMPARRIEETFPQDASVFDLVTVMGELLKRTRTDNTHQVFAEPYSVEEQIEEIRAMLAARTVILLTQIVGARPKRALLVVTFLALLELTRLQQVFLEQTSRYCDIQITRRGPAGQDGGTS